MGRRTVSDNSLCRCRSANGGRRLQTPPETFQRIMLSLVVVEQALELGADFCQANPALLCSVVSRRHGRCSPGQGSFGLAWLDLACSGGKDVRNRVSHKRVGEI